MPKEPTKAQWNEFLKHWRPVSQEPGSKVVPDEYKVGLVNREDKIVALIWAESMRDGFDRILIERFDPDVIGRKGLVETRGFEDSKKGAKEAERYLKKFDLNYKISFKKVRR